MITWLLRRFRYVKNLEKNLDKAIQDHVDYVTGKITLEDIAVSNGCLELTLSTEFVNLIGAHFVKVLDGCGAINYVEMTVEYKGKYYTNTIQRCEGKTPHQLRGEAEQKLASVQQFRLVQNEIHEVDIYHNGEIVERTDSDAAWEIAQIADGRLCRISVE